MVTPDRGEPGDQGRRRHLRMFAPDAGRSLQRFRIPVDCIQHRSQVVERFRRAGTQTQRRLILGDRLLVSTFSGELSGLLKQAFVTLSSQRSDQEDEDANEACRPHVRLILIVPQRWLS